MAKTALLALLLAAALSFSLTNVTGCASLSAADRYVLQNDINATGDCIVIRSSGVDLDCAGHTIRGNGSTSGGPRLIYDLAVGPLYNVSVENCILTNGSGAIVFTMRAGGNVSNITAYNNWMGLNLGGYGNSSGANIVSYGNTMDGIYASGTNVTISNVTVYNNGRYGVGIYASNSTFSGITAFNCSNSGIALLNSNNTVRDSLVYNSTKGVYFSYSSNDTISNLTILGNGNMTDGIYMDMYCYYNSISNFSVDNVTRYGIYLYTATANSTLYNGTITNANNTGLYLGYTNNNTVSLLNLSGNRYAYFITGSSAANFVQQFYNTTINGAPMFARVCQGNEAMGVIPAGAAAVYVANCANFSLSGINVSNGYSGMLIANCSNGAVDNAGVLGNYYGIELAYSTNLSISNISAYNNTVAVYLYYSGNNTVSDSSFVSGGIYSMYSDYNSIRNVNTTACGTGINVYRGNGNSVTGLRSVNDSFGVVFAAANGASIRNSTITGSTGPSAGLMVRGDSGLATNNNVVSGVSVGNGAKNGLYLFNIVNNLSVSDSDFYGNANYGAYMDWQVKNSTFRNVSLRNSLGGIYAYRTVYNNTFATMNIRNNSLDGVNFQAGNLNNTFSDSVLCSNNLSGGAYYDYYMANASVETNTTCDTSVPGGVCDAPCATANSPPAMNSSRISPSPSAYANSTLDGYCQATDPDGDNVSYYFTWYSGGAANVTGTTAAYSSGTEALVSSISLPFSVGQNWTLGCTASDGAANSTELNSSATEIAAFPNTAPVAYARISPQPAAAQNDTLIGFCNGSDADGDNLTFHYTWYLHGIANASGSTGAHAQGAEINAANMSGLSGGQNWSFGCVADDGVANSSEALSAQTTVVSAPSATLVLSVRSNLLTQATMTGILLDGQAYPLSPEVGFAPGQSKLVRIALNGTLPCAGRGELARFEQVAFIYSLGAIPGYIQVGAVPLALRCS